MEKDAKNQENENSIKGLISKPSKFKLSFYKVLSLLYNQLENFPKESKTKTLLFFFSSLFSSLQLASVLFEPGLSLANWKNFQVLWAIFYYSRLDSILQTLINLKACTIIMLSIPLVAGLSFAVLLLYQYFQNSTKFYLIWLLKSFIFLQETQGLTLILFSFDVLTSLTLKSGTSKYQGTLGGSECGISFAALVILIVFEYCSLTFGYEFRHFFGEFNINSRSSNQELWKSRFVMVGTVGVYCLISSLNIVAFWVVCFICNLGAVVLIIRVLPYYQVRANYLQLCPHAFACNGALVLIIGNWINSGVFCAFGVFFVTPMVLLVVFEKVRTRNASLKPLRVEMIQNVQQFELLYRKTLFKSPDDPKKLLYTFNYLFYKSKCNISKFFLLWFTSFCFYNCERHRLSLIKNSLFLKVTPGLGEDFLEYCLRKQIYSVVEIEFLEYSLLRKYRKTEKLKSLEKNTILDFLEFEASMITSNSSLWKLESKMNKLKKSLNRILSQYLALSSRFSNSLIVLNPFLKFIEIFRVDLEKIVELQHKVKAVSNNIRFIGSKLENEHDNCPIFLVSATRHDYGRVFFANKPFLDMTRHSTEEVLNSSIDSLFPDSFKVFEIGKMRQFKEEIYESTKYLNTNGVIRTSDGNIIEVSIQVTLMSYSKAFFLFCVDALELERETLVVNKFGIVEGCTVGVRNFLGSDVKIVGSFLMDLIPINLRVLKQQKNREMHMQYPPLLVQYSKVDLFGCKMRVIYLYKNVFKREQIQMDLTEITSSKKIRGSFLLSHANSLTNKLTFLPRIEEESVNSLKEEENEKLIEKSQKFAKKPKKTLFLLSMRLIKAFHWVIILSILAVCASNLFSTIFLQDQISLINSRTNFVALTTSISSLSVISCYSYILSLHISGYANLINETKTEMANSINTLELNKNNFSQSAIWDFCPDAQNLLFGYTIPVFSAKNSEVVVSFETAYQFFSLMISAGSNFLDKYENSKDYSEEMRFIQYNSHGKTLDVLLSIQNIIVSCENNSIGYVTNVSIVLVACGIGLVSICALVCAAIINKIQKSQYVVWKKLLKIAMISKNFRDKCKNHLESFYHTKFEFDESQINYKANLVNLKFYPKYSLTVLIFISISITYYIIAYYNFYSVFEEDLQIRMKLMLGLSQCKLSLVSLYYWEINQYTFPHDINYLLGKNSFFSNDYSRIIDEEVAKLIVYLQTLEDNKDALISTGNMFELLFMDQNSEFYTKKGTVSGIFAWIFDGFYALSKSFTNSELFGFMSSFNNIREELSAEFNYYWQESKVKTSGLVQEFITFTCCFFIVFAVFYMAWIRTFLKREAKCNKHVEFLTKLLTEEDSNLSK